MAHRFSKEELDEQFEEFLKESLSDDSLGDSKKKSSVLDTLGQPRKREAKKKDAVPWWLSEEDSADGGMLGASRSFVKAQKTSQAVGESDENMPEEKMQLQRSSEVDVSLSRDSLDTHDSVLASGPKQGIVEGGLDTLEEQEEKEIFFAKLEQEASSTLDYSRLNKELDANDSAMLAQLERNEETEKGEGEPAHEDKSGSYSEDFEDETDSNPPFKPEGSQMDQDVDLSPPEQEEADSGMLAKVVLLDSQNSTTELQKATETSNVAPGEHCLPEGVSGTEINEAGTSYGQSTTELEALHQAYHRVGQSLGDSDEQKLQDFGGAGSECLVQGVPHTNDICLQNISTAESDLPTVEELMKPIKGHSFNIRSFPVEPVSPVKLMDSTANDLISHSPLTEQQNNAVWEANSIEKSNREESNFPQRAVSDENVQRATEKEIWTSEVQPDVLREKTVQDSLLSQGSKTKQALHSHSLKKERPGSVPTKAMSNKNIRNPSPVPKKKPPHGPYGLVRSSGYGKPTSPSKLSVPASEKKQPKETFQNTSMKPKTPADRSRAKAAFPAQDHRSSSR